jgi:hypothetical protein
VSAPETVTLRSNPLTAPKLSHTKPLATFSRVTWQCTIGPWGFEFDKGSELRSSLPLSTQNVGGTLDKLTLRRLDVNERFKKP